MARKPVEKKAEDEVKHEAVTLEHIASFCDKGSAFHINQVSEYADDGLVELGGEIDDNGFIAARITQKGLESIGLATTTVDHTSVIVAANPATKPSNPGSFAIASFSIPENPRRNRGRGRGDSYPFDVLEVGQAFFVPATAERPDPAKSMSSTITSANARYTEETGNTVVKERKIFARGDDGKVLMEDGKRVVLETVSEEVPETRPVRLFGVTPVEDGAPFGAEYAGVAGAAVYRSK